jgi:hypothetical protein
MPSARVYLTRRDSSSTGRRALTTGILVKTNATRSIHAVAPSSDNFAIITSEPQRTGTWRVCGF